LLFSATTEYPAGDAPRSVAIADLDGDGVLDLAVAALHSDAVLVLLGNSDGSFQDAKNHPAGSLPVSVATGDLNADGALDLVAADYSSGDVLVLLGHGDGSFDPAVAFHVGGWPISVATADLNGDGALDVVANNFAHWLGDEVLVLLGNGDGTPQSAVGYEIGGHTASVAIGDLEGDGALDLVTADSSVGPEGADLWVLLGNGDGSFQAAVAYPAGDEPSSVVIGDLDANGVADLAVSNRSSHDVSVLLGRGDGTFESPVAYGADQKPSSLAVGDVDGDYALDLAVANRLSHNVSVLVNRLAGPPMAVEIDIRPWSDPNPINPFGQGLIPVAILTTEDFDALTVDDESVLFGLDEAEKVHGQAHFEDVDDDGDLDLLLHFRTQDTGIALGDTEACLIGQTYDGIP
jgi:hypothetical protein